MISGSNHEKERNGATQLLQYTAPTENKGFPQLYAYETKDTSHETNDEDMYLNMDHEKNSESKLDYLFFQSSRILQASEIQTLKNQSEQKRTQILATLIWSLENPRLAWYMITGNRSMFLETYSELMLQPDPIIYEGQIQFVNPITRQTQPAAN